MKAFSKKLVMAMVLLTVAMVGAAVSAQGWQPYAFEVSESYQFRVVTYEQDGYEDDDWTIPRMVPKVMNYEFAVRATGDVNEYDEPLFQVSTTHTQVMPQSSIAESAGFGGFGGQAFLDFGVMMNPFVFMFIQPFFEETEWEVGERMSILGFGRVSISGEETLAGRKGYVIQLETGDAGSRVVTGEWIIDPDLAMPIGVRNYDDQGTLTSEVILEAYQRL